MAPSTESVWFPRPSWAGVSKAPSQVRASHLTAPPFLLNLCCFPFDGQARPSTRHFRKPPALPSFPRWKPSVYFQIMELSPPRHADNVSFPGPRFSDHTAGATGRPCAYPGSLPRAISPTFDLWQVLCPSGGKMGQSGPQTPLCCSGPVLTQL